MRDIKFRGKRLDNGEWVYGYYFESFTGIPYIMVLHDHILSITEFYEVDPSTVGQYTGLKDKNGKEIYEGDICRDSKGDIIEIVWMDTHGWGCKIHKGCVLSTGLTFPLWQYDNCQKNGYRQLEVIGNKQDNPELLKE